ncbi:MAG: response regulator [Myxococcales bacterium]|nr:response regulator [Myxococcales bacterium]MCB9715617.1 response regulator [Myxococcales bacterium]
MPALAAYLFRERRAVLVWAVLTLVSVLGLGLVPRALGLELRDTMPEGGRIAVDFLAPILVIVVLTALAHTAVLIQDEAIGQAEDAERRRLQSQQAQQLQRTEQLAMVGQLAVGVAHEVNNPLAYITTNIDYAIAELSEDDRARWQPVLDALHDAADGSRRIAEVVAQLSAHGRQEDDLPRSVLLRTSLEAALRIAHNQLRHRSKVVRRFEADPVVLADTGRLTQVFLNVLINAAQAIPSGHRNDHEIRVRMWSEGDAALVEVTDTGRGIPPEVLARVVEPFFTTKDVGRGTGLGLSISNAIVQGYGGRITIDSTPGLGTRVRIQLPLSERELLPPSRPSNEIPLPRTRRILLIDDDDPVRQGLARALPGQVVAAAHVPQALAEIERDPSFDAIICDVMMPDESGIDFYRKLERSHPELLPRLLFLTGGVFEAQSQEFIRDHDVAVLRKPVRRRELVEALERVMPRPSAKDRSGGGDRDSAA